MSVIKIKIRILLTTWRWRILEYNLLVYHCLSYVWVTRIETLHLNNEGFKYMSLMSVILHCTTYLALSWQTRPPSGRSEWPVTRTAAITTPAVAPVTPPLRTPLLDPRGLNPQLPPAVRSTEFLNHLNRVLLSNTSVSFGNSLRVNVLSYCFNRQATKKYERLERPKT